MQLLRQLMNEPRAPQPQQSAWWDRALVAAVILIAIMEGLSRTDLEWHNAAWASAILLAFSLLWRRTHPLAALLVTFQTMMLLELIARLNGVDWTELNTQVYVLLLPYSLVRWGSGREIVIGLSVILVSLAGVKSLDPVNLSDNIAGGFVLLFPAALGAAMRYRDRAATRELEQFKLREREQLARELHDTVAHYVSAIAVQAQAGLAVAQQQPEAAHAVLTTIESSARQALGEMRAMVGTLRNGEEAALAPQPGLADIPNLARQSIAGLPVKVTLSGDLDGLSAAVSTALYRLAQESITNALRHARQASSITVTVVGERKSVRLRVRDDGVSTGLNRGIIPGGGYGLVGMSERVAIFGGTFNAGRDGAGWQVEAHLPKHGVTQ